MRDFRAQLAVDKAAMSGERVDLLKRAGGEMTPEDALKNSIQSGMEDDSIVDKDAWEKEQREAYRDYVAKGVITFKKGATDMDRNTQKSTRGARRGSTRAFSSPAFRRARRKSARPARARRKPSRGRSLQMKLERPSIARPRSRPGRKSSPMGRATIRPQLRKRRHGPASLTIVARRIGR